MANIRSQIKRNRQNEKRRLRNKARKSEMKTRSKTAVRLAEAGEDHSGAVARAYKAIDKAAKTGAIHKNAAARRKSRLARRINKILSAASGS